MHIEAATGGGCIYSSDTGERPRKINVLSSATTPTNTGGDVSSLCTKPVPSGSTRTFLPDGVDCVVTTPPSSPSIFSYMLVQGHYWVLSFALGPTTTTTTSNIAALAAQAMPLALAVYKLYQ